MNTTMNIVIDSEMKKKLKIKAAEHGISVSNIIQNLIKDFLEVEKND